MQSKQMVRPELERLVSRLRERLTVRPSGTDRYTLATSQPRPADLPNSVARWLANDTFTRRATGRQVIPRVALNKSHTTNDPV